MKERIIITKAMHGIAGMIVCCVKGVKDKEILDFCNVNNPSGTRGGWGKVIKKDKEHPQCEPVACQDVKGRTHFIVTC